MKQARPPSRWRGTLPRRPRRDSTSAAARPAAVVPLPAVVHPCRVEERSREGSHTDVPTAAEPREPFSPETDCLETLTPLSDFTSELPWVELSQAMSRWQKAAQYVVSHERHKAERGLHPALPATWV
ncbi:hypothetical protein STCU_09917 [Strigomonas culicis]|uniref:Uncharacterized protein n=1 Tax=Strigomonas culicis TaxID=28005 RepID=S9V694_9TRYP|nr:hypothetical protein STCU_09917 [Strigomonas culicis]|eukprot:EPY18435.1 hypothetical protein STCU_09917 [Strigomonas culicis]